MGNSWDLMGFPMGFPMNFPVMLEFNLRTLGGGLGMCTPHFSDEFQSVLPCSANTGQVLDLVQTNLLQNPE